VQQSIQDLKDRLNEIKRKIAALQNNVQVILNELKKMIREMYRVELFAMSEKRLINELKSG